LNDTSSKNIELYLPVGTPAGFYETFANGISVEPTVIEITPTNGSSASSLITA